MKILFLFCWNALSLNSLRTRFFFICFADTDTEQNSPLFCRAKLQLNNPKQDLFSCFANITIYQGRFLIYFPVLQTLPFTKEDSWFIFLFCKHYHLPRKILDLFSSFANITIYQGRFLIYFPVLQTLPFTKEDSWFIFQFCKHYHLPRKILDLFSSFANITSYQGRFLVYFPVLQTLPFTKEDSWFIFQFCKHYHLPRKILDLFSSFANITIYQGRFSFIRIASIIQQDSPAFLFLTFQTLFLIPLPLCCRHCRARFLWVTRLSSTMAPERWAKLDQYSSVAHWQYTFSQIMHAHMPTHAHACMYITCTHMHTYTHTHSIW